MGRYVVRRLLITIPVLLLVSLMAASLIRLAPGDAVVAAIAEANATAVTAEELDALRHELGLDRPFLVQYFDWLGGIFVGDFGTSLAPGNNSIASTLKKSIPVSLELAIIAMVISLAVAIPIGVWSAIRQDSPSDYSGRIFAVGGLSIPEFIIGTMVILFGALWFKWTPPLTYVDLWEDPGQNLLIMIIPAAIIGVRLSSITMRMLRSTMLEVMRQDYVRTAWAKGLRERTIIVRHGLKNAFIPVITIIGGQLGFLVGGVVIVESIFNLPGLGRALLDAINSRDLPMVQSAVLVIAASLVFINLLVDLSYGWFDPRIRYQ